MTSVRLIAAGTWEEQILTYQTRILDFLAGAGHVDATEQDPVIMNRWLSRRREEQEIASHAFASGAAGGPVVRAYLDGAPRMVTREAENPNPPVFAPFSR